MHFSDTAYFRSTASVFTLALLALTAPAQGEPSVTTPLVLADATDDGSDTDIIVSARRRDERAQDVPIALSVIGQETLEKTGNYTLGQIQQLVPSIQIFSFNPRNTNINIRGLGSNVAITNDGLENGVGVYIDNVYYGRVGQTQFDLVDLDHVEVLRGPQGTLFGKNTTAGAINISSRAPAFQPEFSGEATIGNHGAYQLRGSLSAPIVSDIAAFRLSAAETRHDGFIDDVRTGQKASDYDNFSVRGQLLVKPAADVQIRLIGDFARQKAHCCIQLPVGVFTRYANGAPVPNNFYDRIARAGYAALPIDPFARKTDADSHFQANMKSYGLSGELDWDLGGAALTSVSAYRWWDWNPANDSDALGLPIFTINQQANRQRQFSQELRIASTGKRKIDYVIGAYYFWQVVRGYGDNAYGAAAPDWYRPPSSPLPLATWNAALNGFRAQSTSTPETRSYAVFGQTTWHISEPLSLTTGLRFTHEAKSGDFRQAQISGLDISAFPGAQAIRDSFNPVLAYSARRADSSLSGLVSLAYKVAPDVLVYTSYSRGNKSGGINLTNFPLGVVVPTSVQPERVNSYEVGLKSQFLDRRLTVNAAGFWTDVKDFQSAITTLTNLGTYLQYIQNVGAVRSRGFELDAQAQPNDRISFTASLAYTDNIYRSYHDAPAPVESANLGATTDLSGQQIAGAPKFTYTLAADVAQPLGIDALWIYGHADFAHRSGFFTQVTNSVYSRVPGYGLTNARIGLRTDDSRWDLSLWVRNLFDKHYFQTLSPANTGLITGLVGDPRTFGVTLRTKL
jgi:iron complex outermembrane receptor protein